VILVVAFTFFQLTKKHFQKGVLHRKIVILNLRPGEIKLYNNSNSKRLEITAINR